MAGTPVRSRRRISSRPSRHQAQPRRPGRCRPSPRPGTTTCCGVWRPCRRDIRAYRRGAPACELGFVDGHEQHAAPPLGRGHQPQCQNASRLRYAFDHQYTRHDRIFREGSELRLVHRQVLDADAMIVAAHADDTVDQQKRIAVRQQPEDFCNIGDTSSFVAHHSCPSALTDTARVIRRQSWNHV